MSYARDHLIPLVDEGLGNSAYLADLGDGRALAVDASRDLRALRQAASRRGLRVAFAADTHLHADFLSGAVQLAADDGATVLAAAAGHRAFPHTALADGEEADLGGLTLRALATPGHTDEHLSYLLLDGTRELGVFTGGSLIVGSAARTDLLGASRAEELARAQYRSLRRLATLPDETAVWPTHGAGSFCSAPPGAARVTTIGAEKAANPLLAAPDEDAFARRLLDSLGSYPAYFARLAEVNRRGPALLAGQPGLAPLTPAALGALMDRGGRVIDTRPVAGLRRRAHPRRAVHPAAGGVRHLAGLADTGRRAAGLRARRRPGPGRGRLAGAEDRLREPGRAAGRRHGRLAGGRQARPTAPSWSPPGRWTTARCWTSGKTPSTPPGTSPARSTSSSATCPPGRRTHPPGRW